MQQWHRRQRRLLQQSHVGRASAYGERQEDSQEGSRSLGDMQQHCTRQTVPEAVPHAEDGVDRKVPLFLLKEHALTTPRCMAEAGQLPFSSNLPLYM